MHFTHLILKNWRNFTHVDLAIGDRLFLVGPNASGKSNLLDVFRFVRDIAKPGGGLQQAVSERGGLARIRSLAARRYPLIEVELSLRGDPEDLAATWKYSIGLQQESRGARRVLLAYERVWKGEQQILNRPNTEDKKDDWRLTQTHLEQISANLDFRVIAEAFQKTVYLHLVPQLLKFPSLANREFGGEDPFGLRFLDRIMQTPERPRRSRLRKIEQALRTAVPEMKNLVDTRDERGQPHLEVLYQHWRPDAGRQREDQFSDGTIRLIGLLWSLLEGDALLLLEEPELSLHPGIVARLPALMWRLQRSRKRQVMVSTHSVDLLQDRGIQPSEVVLLRPQGSEGTVVKCAADLQDIVQLMEHGASLADVVIPATEPRQINQLSLFL